MIIGYQVSNSFKENCKSNFATNRQGKIHVVEDNIDIVGENYDGQLVDFSVEDNCYVNDKFIGTTVAKKITVNILNPNNSINLENKEIQAFAGINGEYVPFGNFIIQKPDNEEVKEKTSFTGYDYMIKFNTSYKDQVQYPILLVDLLSNLCSQVGLTLGNTEFTNSNYMVLGNPFTNNEDCRTVLSNIAQLAGGFAKIGRDNKVYIKTLKNISNLLTVKYVNAMTVKELNLTEVRALSGNQSNADETIDGNNYFDNFSKNDQWGELNSLVLGISSIEGENTALDDKSSIAENGLTEITINDNYFLTSQEEREKVIVPMWDSLKGLKYLPFKTKYYGYPYLDSGDIIYIKDINDNGYISYVFNHTFTFNGSFSGNIETTALTKTQTAYKNTFDVKSKFKQVERSVDKINGQIVDIVEQQTETENKLTKVEQDIDGITQTVSSVEEQVDGTNQNISQTNQKVTQIEQTVEEITQTVDEVQTNIDENYSTTEEMNSKIEQTAGEINLEVSNTINNIQVGGTNLIPNSAPYDTTGYYISDTSGIELTLQNEDTAPYKKCLRIRTLKQLTSTSGIYIYPTKDKLEEGKEYCFSIWLRATANTIITVGYNAGGSTSFNVTTSWQKFIHKFTATATSSNKVGFPIYLPVNTVNGRQVFIHSIKLEEGNQITAWSPAPSDDVKGSEIISKINMSPEEIQISADKISLEGKEINLTSENISINSNNFNVDKNGNLTCSNATFTNGHLDYYSSTGAHLGVQGITSDSETNSEGICLTVYSADAGHPLYMVRSFNYGTIMTIETISDSELNGVSSSSGYSGIVKINSAIKSHNVFCNYLEVANNVVDYIYCVNNLFVNGYVRGTNIINSSDESLKENIKKLSTKKNTHLDTIRKSDICEFNYKGQKEKTIGLVIGKNYSLPDEVIKIQIDKNGNESRGVDLYSMVSLAWQAIKEQQEIIEELEQKVEGIKI